MMADMDERSENSDDGERDGERDGDSLEENASNGSVSVKEEEEEEISHKSDGGGGEEVGNHEIEHHYEPDEEDPNLGYQYRYEPDEEDPILGYQYRYEPDEEDPNLAYQYRYRSDEEDPNLGYQYRYRSDEEDRRRICYDSDEPIYKRLKPSTTKKEDRLSALPDSVLPHILSFLPTKEAVKTGILSRRWLYLWTCVPNLTFSCRLLPEQKQFTDFLISVDQTLIFHRSDLKKFVLEFRYEDSIHSRVSSWLRFATRANVEKLCLCFNGKLYLPSESESESESDDNDRYVLPQHLYTNSTITKLKLTFCDLMPSGLINWKALKSLSIGNTALGEDMIQKILAGSPLLDSLKLHNFCGFDCLDIHESNLRKLVLRDYWHWDSVTEQAESELKIIAPKLRSLTIAGDMRQRKIKLANLQMMDDCTLSFCQTTDEDEDNYEVRGETLRQVLRTLRHVNKLTLGPSCIEVLSTLEEKGEVLPALWHKCLILRTHIHRGDLPGIASILRSLPFLQTLHIDMTSDMTSDVDGEFHFDEKFFEKYMTSEKEFALVKLKTVRIDGLVGHNCRQEHVIPLAKFLLKIANVLEKMIITAQKVDGRRLLGKNSPRELLVVALKLLSVPRSSVQAVVEICE